MTMITVRTQAELDAALATIHQAPTRRMVAERHRADYRLASVREHAEPATGLTRHGAHCGCTPCVTRAHWLALIGHFTGAAA